MSNKNRNKGHNLERLVARDLREIWPQAVTSRANSVILDACEVDIDNVPYLIQCKSGYARARPKADVLFRSIVEKVTKAFGKERASLPPVLVHKIDGRHAFGFLVTITYEHWLELIKK